MKRIMSQLLSALLAFSAIGGQTPGFAEVQDEAAHTSQHASQAVKSAVNGTGGQDLEHVEEKQGPFTLAGQTFTVTLHHKCFPGKSGLDSRTLVLLDIRDGRGKVQYQESFPSTIQEGAFLETCSAGARLLPGSNGTGLLIESACSPSAPLTGGPWQVFGVVGGNLVRFGKPLVTEGELGEFVPGAISRTGNLTRVLPDTLMVRVWTGYFFVSVPIRIDWRKGKLALGQHCMHQTGHGFAEEGCEMPAEEARMAPREQEMTFVRMFRDSNDRNGPPAHVVVKMDSKVDIVACKVLIIWNEGGQAVYLSTGEDVWVKVCIDGKQGWIHTPEDLNAIGLFRSG